MMERFISVCLWLTLVLYLILRVAGNAEGDVLNALKTNMADPNNVLESWNATDDNPCAWFHVTCNDENSVTRVDLQNANLSGQVVPQLGQLPNLQFLELNGNNLSGIIPEELGNLTNLVSLDLFLNNLTGGIPNTLGKLTKLCYLRLNNNSLTGTIPAPLTTVMTLEVLDLSNNQLVGDIPVNGSFMLFNSSSFSNNKLNNPPPASQTSSGQVPIFSRTSSGNSVISAIFGGVFAGALLLLSVPAIIFARRLSRNDRIFYLRTQNFIWDNLKGFLCMNYKRQLIILATKMLWVVVVLVEFIKVI